MKRIALYVFIICAFFLTSNANATLHTLKCKICPLKIPSRRVWVFSETVDGVKHRNTQTFFLYKQKTKTFLIRK